MRASSLILLPSPLLPAVVQIARGLLSHTTDRPHIVTIDSFADLSPTRVTTPHQTPALAHSDPASQSPDLHLAPLSLSSPQTIPQHPASLVPAVRRRSELEEGQSDGSSTFTALSSRSTPLSYLHPSSEIPRAASPVADNHPAHDPELSRTRKRQRLDTITSSAPASFAAALLADSSLSSLISNHPAMRLHDSDHDSISLDSGPEAGPSSAAATSNGHNGIVAKSNGFALPFTNGTSTNGASKAYMPDGAHDHAAERGGAQHIARVSLPGSTLYDDSYVDREEFVRLVIQSLRDVGYIESAATLEAESGYTMEMPEVSEFRRCILDASWDRADVALMRLGVADDERLWEARFLISQQKYLELLEAHKTTAALHVLRNELAPMNVDPDQLHSLSSLIMCSDADDLRQRAGWDGAAGTSRRRLLVNLQQYIPSSVMIPQRRFSTLLDQARTWQQSQCLYHNAPLNSRTFSLYTNHHCDRNAFPQVTTAILEGHTNEVWNLEWSHSGHYLASTSRDNSAIIWRIEFDRNPSERMYRAEHILGDHPFPVGCASWSLDDSILLTAAEHFIKMWNTRTGACIRTMDTHSDHVTSLVWLPDNSGFISGGLDRKIILWDVEGKQRDTWGITPIRVTDLVLTPDCTRLVAIGMYDLPHPPSSRSADTGTPSQGSPAHDEPLEARIIVYDLATKQLETSIQIEGELTSVKVTQDSQYVLVNKSGRTTTTSLPSSPDARGPKTEVCLWDLNTERIVRKYKGHRQKQEVIRSCFGGIDGSFVVSGSEDGNVYVWHRDSGTLLEVLSGHGAGSVNTVAWHPRNERMFASCSDDKTIRIWEAPPGGAHGTPADVSEHPSRDEGKGKGKNRERWDHTGHGAALG